MSPRSKEQIEKIKAERKELILDTALQLMSKKGYNATTVDLISSEASISKGLIYNYFESKESILKALVELAFADIDLIFTDVEVNSPADRLEQILEFFFTALVEKSSLYSLISMLSLRIDEFPFMKTFVIKQYNGYLDTIHTLLKQIGFKNAAEEAKLLTALFDGIGFQYLVLKKDYPLQDIKNYLISKYCKTNS